MSHQYNDMTEPELTEHMQMIADMVNVLTPPETAFVVLVTPFNESSAVQYISNGNRDDIKKSLEEILGRWENDPSLIENRIPPGESNEV